MKKFLVGLLLGLVAGGGLYWYFQENQGGLRDTVGEIRLEDIQQELAKSGMIVRQRARQAGAALADATADARATASIKARLSTELGLTTLTSVSVNTSDGLVTLSGTVDSHEQIAKAVRIAWETDGVHKIVSTLQVKSGR